MAGASFAQQALARSNPAWGGLNRAIQASERAAKLTRQLLAYAGKGQFVRERVNLSQLIGEMRDLLFEKISEKISLCLDLRQGLPEFEADPAQVRQIVMNLVRNAAEAIGEGPEPYPSTPGSRS